MKKLLILVTLLLSTALSSLARPDVVFALEDIQQVPEPGVRVQITPRSTAGANGGRVVGNDFKTRVTDATGSTTFSNLFAGVYDCAYLWTNRQTAFQILVPNTNGSVSASSLMVSNAAALAAASRYYTAPASDARFVLKTNGYAVELELISSNSPAPARGQVWTSTGTNGSGAWSNAPAAGNSSGFVASEGGLATNLFAEGTIRLLENGVDRFHIYTLGGNLQIEDESVPRIILNWDPIKGFFEFSPAITTGSSTNTGNSTTGGTNFSAYFSGNGSLLTGVPTTAELNAASNVLRQFTLTQSTNSTNFANQKIASMNGLGTNMTGRDTTLVGATAILGSAGTNGLQVAITGSQTTVSDYYSANTLWVWSTLSMIWEFAPSIRLDSGYTNAGSSTTLGTVGANQLVSSNTVTATNFVASGVAASRAAAWDSLKGLISATTTLTELNFLSGVTSSVQTQLDAKFSLAAGNSVSNAFLVTSNGLIATSNQLVTAIAALNAASNALVIVSNTLPNKVGATNGQAYGLTLNGVATNAGSFYNVQSNLVYTGTAGAAQTNIHIDFSFGNEFYLLLTNNAFLIPTNMRPAQVVNVEIWQDGTGSRSVTWQPTITTNAGGLAISNAANARSVLTLKAGKYATNTFGVMQAGFQ